jgi:phenylalanyl-tRNA synthetase beta chain
MQISGLSLGKVDLETFLHPGRECDVTVHGQSLGYIGEVHPDVMAKMDLKNRVVVCELDLDVLADLYKGEIHYKDFPKYPSSSRDVAFLVKEDVEAGKMTGIAIDSNEELLEKVCVFDVYDGRGVPAGMKSLGLRFSYRAVERTLTDVEINDVHSRIVTKIIAESGAKIRGEENL